MPWVEVFAALVVSHLVGDYLLQTEWQAVHKHRGLARGETVARRALLGHVASYTVAFVPALVWLGANTGAEVAWVLVLISVPHAIQDDGRLIVLYMQRVKGVAAESAAFAAVAVAVDQTFHLLTLFALALLAGT
ncbi:MAG TPA: DUF3307 domain-containing protein [Solirubrobacteraceae bacterium]|jgi:hypothetical protein|nr:DUF3307 domain-containing protein [Solirubrobacteraceae bacterium]